MDATLHDCLALLAVAGVGIAIVFVTNYLKRLKYVKEHSQLDEALTLINNIALGISTQLLNEPTPVGRANLKKALVADAVLQVKEQLPKTLGKSQLGTDAVTAMMAQKVEENLKK